MCAIADRHGGLGWVGPSAGRGVLRPRFADRDEVHGDGGGTVGDDVPPVEHPRADTGEREPVAVKVRTGASNGRLTEVVAGALAPGDAIITNNLSAPAK